MVLMFWGERGEMSSLQAEPLKRGTGWLCTPTRMSYKLGGPPSGGTRQDKLHGPVVEQPEQKSMYCV